MRFSAATRIVVATSLPLALLVPAAASADQGGGKGVGVIGGGVAAVGGSTDSDGFGSGLFARCLQLAMFGAASKDPVCRALGSVLAGGVPSEPEPSPSPSPSLSPSLPLSPPLGLPLPSPSPSPTLYD